MSKGRWICKTNTKWGLSKRACHFSVLWFSLFYSELLMSEIGEEQKVREEQCVRMSSTLRCALNIVTTAFLFCGCNTRSFARVSMTRSQLLELELLCMKFYWLLMNFPNKVSLLLLNVDVPAGERWDLGCFMCPNWWSYSKSAAYTNLVIAVLQILLSASLTCSPLNPWMLTPSSPMQNALVAELLPWRITTQKVCLFRVCFGRTCLIGGAPCSWASPTT